MATTTRLVEGGKRRGAPEISDEVSSSSLFQQAKELLVSREVFRDKAGHKSDGNEFQESDEFRLRAGVCIAELAFKLKVVERVHENTQRIVDAAKQEHLDGNQANMLANLSNVEGLIN
jgi:hypothetical protein